MEYLLLHEFHLRKFILPDKLSQKEKEKEAGKRKAPVQADPELQPDGDDGDNGDVSSNNAAGKKGKKGPAYLGGLVLEPKKGLYDKYILLLDFNSLYPSIIQVHPTIFASDSSFRLFVVEFSTLLSPFKKFLSHCNRLPYEFSCVDLGNL